MNRKSCWIKALDEMYYHGFSRGVSEGLDLAARHMENLSVAAFRACLDLDAKKFRNIAHAFEEKGDLQNERTKERMRRSETANDALDQFLDELCKEMEEKA